MSFKHLIILILAVATISCDSKNELVVDISKDTNWMCLHKKDSSLATLLSLLDTELRTQGYVQATDDYADLIIEAKANKIKIDVHKVLRQVYPNYDARNAYLWGGHPMDCSKINTCSGMEAMSYYICTRHAAEDFKSEFSSDTLTIKLKELKINPKQHRLPILYATWEYLFYNQIN